MAAIPLATVIGAPLSGLLLELDGVYGLKGWQWLFIVEGVPAVLLGFLALKVLDDGPATAKWLSAPERKALSTALAADERAARKHGYDGLVEAMTRPRIFALALLYFLIVIGLYGIGFWMPQLIQNFGLPNLTVGFLTAIPYLGASLVMVLCGWNSDRTGERRWHIALPLLIGAAAFAWSAYAHDLLRCDDRALDRDSLHLCRGGKFLVVADRDPVRHRGGGRARADQFDRQSRRVRRTDRGWRGEGSNGKLHSCAPVPRSRPCCGRVARAAARPASRAQAGKLGRSAKTWPTLRIFQMSLLPP